MQILWCAKLEPVLKPPLLTNVRDVSCNVVFSEGGGGEWSRADCAGEGPGSYPGHCHKAAATAGESRHPLRCSAVAHCPAPAVPPTTISRDQGLQLLE